MVQDSVRVRLTIDAVEAARGVSVDLASSVRAAIKQVVSRLDLPDIRMLVRVAPKRTIPETGEGGFANPVTGSVTVWLDPHHEKFGRTLHVWLPLTIAHELHHSARILNGPGYGETLLEAMVTEGLAQVFSREVVVDPPIPPWSRAVSGTEVCHHWAEAKRDSRDGAYDHDAWFFGTREIPRWTGYTLGHELIETYLRRRPSESAASLTDASARRIVREAKFCDRSS